MVDRRRKIRYPFNTQIPLIIAGGDPSAVTYLRGDGQWAEIPISSGGGESVLVPVAFGTEFLDKMAVVVTGETWVTSTSCIIPHVLTPVGVDTDEMYLLGITAQISDLVVGTGFTVTLYSEPEARGTYNVMCLGV